jgi:invasion protein IalB
LVLIAAVFSVASHAATGEPIRLAQSWWWPSQSAQAPVAAPAPAAPGTPGATAPQTPPAPVPHRTEIVRFDGWAVTCNEFTEGPRKRVCSAQLLVQQQGTNQIVLAWVISINDNKQFVTAMQSPTGVRIGPGIEIQLEKVAKRTIPFESCEPQRCIASMVMDATMMRDVTASTKAQIVIHAVSGQVLNFDIPVKGFDKASAQLRTSN